MNPTLQATIRRRPVPSRRPDWHAAASPSREAGDCLERTFAAPAEEKVSFLVNGMYLYDRHRILEWEPEDGRIAAGLEALGHRVVAAGAGTGRGPRPGGGLPAGAFDRAMRISRALGYGGAEEDRAWLKAMRRALRPGGLLVFHALDRDRAWSLVEAASTPGRPGSAGAAAAAGAGTRIGFDPGTGKVTFRVRRAEGTGRGPCGRSEVSITAYNLESLRTMLAEAGLELERAYGDWSAGSLEEAGPRTGRILAVASKPRAAAGRRKGGSGAGRRHAAEPEAPSREATAG